jgi:hypothetical protein
LSLATEDFNEDGWPDLAAGYTTAQGDGVAVLYFGDREAYAPEKPETLAGIAQNRFPLPFLSEARAFALPEAPDFLAAGDFNRDGNPGLLVGARGSEQIFILAGDGRGGLGTPQGVALPGKLTALAAGHIGHGDSWPDVAMGVVGSNGPELLIYKGGLGGLFAPPVVYSLEAAATSLKIGNLDDDPYGDVGILAGGSLFILHGQLWRSGAANGVPRSAAPELESVPVSSDVTAFAIGDFIWERNNRMEIAVLAGSGVQILSRGTPDKRPVSIAQIRAARMAMARLRLARLRAGTPPPVPLAWQPGATQPWQVAQSINVGGAASASELEAVTTALPDRAPQSVLLVGASASQLHLLTEPPGPTNANPAYGSGNSTNSASGAVPQVAASWSDDVAATGGAPAAILPMRVNVSAQPGLVTLNQGQAAPMVMISAGGASYSVNRNDDPTPGAASSVCNGVANDCSLREAIIKADSTSGATVNIPTGTYTLTIGENDDPNADPTEGDLDINASMTIAGAGAGSTIIKANFPSADGQDGKIFGVNQLGNVDGAQVSISGVTLENAVNSVGYEDPLFTETGSAVDFFLTGTSTSYTLSGCVIQNNTNVHAYGGGINVDSGGDNAGTNHGTVTISNCTIIGNSTQGVVSSNSTSGANCAGQCDSAWATGGGVNLFADVDTVIISNSIISNNKTGTAETGSYPDEGGGIWIQHTNGGSVTISATAIGDSVNGGNQSASRGGGISIDGEANQTVTINQASSLVNNLAGARNVSTDVAEGGGIYIASEGTTSLTQVTITGNSLSSNAPEIVGGGGIAVGELKNGSGSTQTLTVSECRIAGNSAGSGTGAGLHKDSDPGTVTATDNWWGCNAGPSASPCDTAVLVSGSGSLNFTPWLKLSLSPSTAQSVENTDSINFTADLNHDSNGNPVGSNIPNGTPVGFGTTGGIGSDNPTSTTTTSGTAGSTFTGSAVGSGTVSTTVDSQTVSTPVTVYIPVTIASSPTGESFTVTGGTACAAGSYGTPQTLDWSATSCTVQFTSPVSNGTGKQLAFSQWADGNTNNPRTITTPASATTFTANFVQQYQLTTAVSPAGGGTVTTPASGTYLTSGAATTLTATANTGYNFTNWSVTSGAATFGSASSASTTVTLSSGPATVQANFQTQTTPTVTFTGAPVRLAYQGTFTVSSTTNSSSPPVYTSSGACTNNGTLYTMTSGTGQCISTVTWAPDSTYTGATLSQSTNAIPLIPTVTFTGMPASLAYQGTFTVASTTNSSSLPVYTSSGACTNSGTLYTMTSGKGQCRASVTWAADTNYTGDRVSRFVEATSIAPTVTFGGAPASAPYQGTFTVTSTTNSSSPPVYSSSGSCYNTGALYTMKSATGTCTSTVTWADDAYYTGASLSQTTTATTSAQTITFTQAAPSSANYKSTFPVAASSTSGLKVVLSVDAGSAGVCSLASGTVTMLSGTGTCTIDANQAGNSHYGAAPQAQTSATAQEIAQTISFTELAPSTASYNSTFYVAAKSTSGLAVALSVDAGSAGICTLEAQSTQSGVTTGRVKVLATGRVKVLIVAGTCAIDANQAGNANYTAAAQQQTSATIP